MDQIRMALRPETGKGKGQAGEESVGGKDGAGERARQPIFGACRREELERAVLRVNDPAMRDSVPRIAALLVDPILLGRGLRKHLAREIGRHRDVLQLFLEESCRG